MRTSLPTVFLALALLAGASPAAARDLPEITITLKDHRFSPPEIRVPANTRFRLVVENQDPAAEEFESYDFNREKIVPGHGRVSLFVGPLRPGRYRFFGEFNPDSAQGALIAE